MLRSGISSPALGCLQRLMNTQRCFLAMSNSVDHFSSAIDAIATCKISRVGGAHGLGIDDDAAVTEFQIGNPAQELYNSLLPQCFDHHTHIQLKFGPRRR